MYPEGSLVRFLGDLWLDSVKGEIGLVVEHGTLCAYEESMRVLVNNRSIDIIYGEFEDSEMELVQ